MSTTGTGSGVDFVRRMQPGGDFENEWVMFNHVKRVDKWTTLGVHVYDPMHCKTMTIAVCDMKLEMAEHQVQMWKSMLVVLKKHALNNVNFKDFMADSVQANFMDVRVVFGSGDKDIPMENKERTCQFHSAQCLE